MAAHLLSESPPQKQFCWLVRDRLVVCTRESSDRYQRDCQMSKESQQPGGYAALLFLRKLMDFSLSIVTHLSTVYQHPHQSLKLKKSTQQLHEPHLTQSS